MKIGTCVKCGKNRPLNKKGNCSECTWELNHPGQRQNLYINPVSKKKSKALSKKTKSYQSIDEEREHVCSGCGRSNVSLSHSHLIPVSFDKQFESDKRNIKLHCMGSSDSCHRKWESHNLKLMKQLLDYEESMEYIKEVCPQYYNKLIVKCQ